MLISLKLLCILLSQLIFAANLYGLIYKVLFKDLTVNDRTTREWRNSWSNNFFQHPSCWWLKRPSCFQSQKSVPAKRDSFMIWLSWSTIANDKNVSGLLENKHNICLFRRISNIGIDCFHHIFFPCSFEEGEWESSMLELRCDQCGTTTGTQEFS